MLSLRTLIASASAWSFYASAGLIDPHVITKETRSLDRLVPTHRDVARRYGDSPTIEAPLEPVVLAPVPYVRPRNRKRDRKHDLALKGQETLHWVGSDGTTAKLKIEMPGETENIVNLEQIDDLIQGVRCPQNGSGLLLVQFAEQANFDDAQDIWNWVNQDAANHFMLVAGPGTCGTAAERTVFDVSGLIYNNENETAILDVRQTTWHEAAHTFDLTVGKPANATASQAQRRWKTHSNVHRRRGILSTIGNAASDAADAVGDAADSAIDAVTGAAGAAASAVTSAAGAAVDAVGDAADAVGSALDSATSADLNPNFSIPFGSDFSGKSLSFSEDGLEISASCTECFTTGSLDIRGRFRAEQFELQEAWIEASTDGLSAKAVIGLTLKGDLAEDKLAEKSVPVFKISPAGVSIPGVLTIGPTVTVELGAEISQIKGGITVSLGGTAAIPPSTSRLDFLDRSGTTATGWDPNFKAEPFKADAFIEAKASAFLKAAIGLEISAVGR